MKEILTKVSFTTFIIGYLFFCGILYIISYWSTFDFDITNYIEIIDIPKSFVFPLATSIGVSILSVLIQALVRSLAKYEKDKIINEEISNSMPLDKIPTKILIKRILNDFNVWALTILIVCSLFYRPRREWVFAIGGLTIMIYSFVLCMKNNWVNKIIPYYYVKFFLCILICIVPVFSFLIGKLDSIDIWKNRKYYQIIDISFKDSTFSKKEIIPTKLLGKLGSSLFITDSLNSKIITLNLDNINAIKYNYITNIRPK